MARYAEVVSHWHHSVENLSTSSLEFYASVEKALAAKQADVRTERIDWNEGGVLSAKREYLRIGYRRYVFDVSAFPFGKDFYFSWWLGKKIPGFAALFGCLGLLAMPIVWAMFVASAGFTMGTILFFVLLGFTMFLMGQVVQDGSSEVGEIIVAVPYLGPIFAKFFKPTTYYSEDTRIMFEETVHRVVIDVVAGVLTANGMSPLAPEQKALTTGSVQIRGRFFIRGHRSTGRSSRARPGRCPGTLQSSALAVAG